jgi:hypothetical protein
MSDDQQAPDAQNLPAVIGVLNSQAYAGDNQANRIWDMTLNPWVWVIEAYTADVYPDAESAQAAANALASALVEASGARLHENGGETRQGSLREVPIGFDIAVFRGAVEVRLHA